MNSFSLVGDQYYWIEQIIRVNNYIDNNKHAWKMIKAQIKNNTIENKNVFGNPNNFKKIETAIEKIRNNNLNKIDIRMVYVKER